MALTLDISPDIETLVRLKANQSGLDVTEYLLRLVESDLNVDLSEHADLEDFASSVAAIQEGLEDIDAGRTFSLEETFAKLEAEKAEWRKERKLGSQKNTHQVIVA